MYVEISHLRYVVAAAEHRSFRRAAADPQHHPADLEQTYPRA